MPNVKEELVGEPIVTKVLAPNPPAGLTSMKVALVQSIAHLVSEFLGGV